VSYTRRQRPAALRASPLTSGEELWARSSLRKRLAHAATRALARWARPALWRAPETTAQGGRSVLVHHPLALEPPLEGLRPLLFCPVAHCSSSACSWAAVTSTSSNLVPAKKRGERHPVPRPIWPFAVARFHRKCGIEAAPGSSCAPAWPCRCAPSWAAPRAGTGPCPAGDSLASAPVLELAAAKPPAPGGNPLESRHDARGYRSARCPRAWCCGCVAEC